MHSSRLPLLVVGALCGHDLSGQALPKRAVVSIERIWDRAPHNAFTDLVRFQGRSYCAFREGTGHVHGFDGTIRVIESADGMNWKSVALLREADVDLRDPKLSVTARGRLMVVMGGSFYRGGKLVKREPRVSLSADGNRFSEPLLANIGPKIKTDNDWLWRVTWRGEVGYGVVYQARGDDWGIHLVSTRDGRDYAHVATWQIDGRPNETTLRFTDDGTMLALVRREGGDRKGWLGRSQPPYRDWSWKPLPHRLGGPNFLVLGDGRLLAATRVYPHTRDGKKLGTSTALAWLDAEGGWRHALTLPSAGDTSYAGMAVHGRQLLVSYYSSHEGKSAIYLARLRLDEVLAVKR